VPNVIAIADHGLAVESDIEQRLAAIIDDFAGSVQGRARPETA
jgi:hypothetical protein